MVIGMFNFFLVVIKIKGQLLKLKEVNSVYLLSLAEHVASVYENRKSLWLFLDMKHFDHPGYFSIVSFTFDVSCDYKNGTVAINISSSD